VTDNGKKDDDRDRDVVGRELAAWPTARVQISGHARRCRSFCGAGVMTDGRQTAMGYLIDLTGGAVPIVLT